MPSRATCSAWRILPARPVCACAPDAKTHKSPEVARRQIALGAVGVCCQKVAEAEIMVAGGIDNVLVSNEVHPHGQPIAAQLADKAALAARALSPVAPDVQWLDPASSAQSHHPNKAKLVVAGRPGRPTFGILDERGRGVHLRRCGLYEPGLAATFDRCTGSCPTSGSSPTTCPAGGAS